MPRSPTGVYTLPVAPFTAGTIIKSADVNSDLSDISTALTQSLATTGVTPMTGPIKAFSGSQSFPGYAFAAALSTGFFLSNPNEISWVAAGVVGAVFGASTTVTWNGQQIYTSAVTFNGGLAVVGSVSITGGLNVANNVFITTTSAEFTSPITLDKQASDPTVVAASKLAFYVKADTFSSTPAPFFMTSVSVPVPLTFVGGQCQLTKSGASLLLSPYGGNRLTVNGLPCIIPDAGVGLAASNSASVFVYIYAVATGGVITSLEMSTTAPTSQAGTGIKQKTGDATRTLVGAAFTDTGGAWADTDGKRWLLSYFNRRRKASRTVLTVSLSSTNTSYVEVDTNLRNNFINWSDETVIIDSKTLANPQITQNLWVQHELDGTTAGDSAISPNVAVVLPITNHSTITGITEAANHFATLYIRGVIVTNTPYICSIGVSSGEGTQLYITVNG